MSSLSDLLQNIQLSTGLTLAEVLASHPNIRRRTAQRWLAKMAEAGQIIAVGEGRARRYFPIKSADAANTDDTFPQHIPLSADSVDILAYVDRPITIRTPVGYQRDFLGSYQPNKTRYLSEPLCRQLKKMGDTGQAKLPAGTYGREILNRLLIDLSWASSHLEGNTYSRLDTRLLIEQGMVSQGKAAIETQMILNHKAAIELLIDNAATIRFNRYTLLNLHSILSENLLPNPADEGRLRQHAVDIGKSVYRPLSVPAQISEILDRILNKANQISDPFEQSFFVMVHLPYLQPFADVNKRTSRLVTNLPMIRANLCPLTFIDVPEQAYSRAVIGVYEMTRIELLRDLYIWAYERSTQEYLAIKQNLSEPEPLRLMYRNIINQTVRETVIQQGQEPLKVIRRTLEKQVPEMDRENVEYLVIAELRRLHEGVLVRYGLSRSEFSLWQAQQSEF
ncbi:Fic family protein [Candidatus Fukatsuia symbiotica]|uniref:Cell filamentation protein Fic n=1 Tax=Candidatus Fukatsuia symbiotica TaxID=1878942 RepID=A0A2U8IAF0_9GAMM|nr:Fic family protein [Candidatus Fukatsuia symbiotica]AWK15125.1 cell filamentation protein Fic [Candidatus Fukatsuia symbiotica]MEA9443942.1 Fic family protein [Candidatus Fukatsuia symbiotica]